MNDATTDVGGITAPASPSPTSTDSNVGVEVVPVPDPKARLLVDISNRFTHHPPKGDQAQRYGQLRDRFRELAERVVLSTPISREQALAITKLEEASMFANAAIARHE